MIYNREGMKGFYRGSMSNVFRSLGASLVLVFYDDVSNYLKNRHPH